jgi:KaiC/GvpD/RAD55 family RecA-like ATPase
MLKGFLEARAAGHKNYNNVLIYEGPIGYGKSRLLAEVVYRTAKEGVRLVPAGSLAWSQISLVS